jgi:hypothetical protein
MTRSAVVVVIAAAALFSAAPAVATPDDPYGEDWVAMAISPEAHIGTYGAAGSADVATQIAMDECAQRSNGARCLIATATQYGCVAYGIDIRTNAWAGGRGPDEDAALRDVATKLPAFTEGDVVGGPACSTPRVRP